MKENLPKTLYKTGIGFKKSGKNKTIIDATTNTTSNNNLDIFKALLPLIENIFAKQRIIAEIIVVVDNVVKMVIIKMDGNTTLREEYLYSMLPKKVNNKANIKNTP